MKYSTRNALTPIQYANVQWKKAHLNSDLLIGLVFSGGLADGY
tara:strand:- start:829 stop:957 length:129 start_codon:yes stop_codon:yes gene_type:complete